ncbi:MAG TPA: DUF3226 domain-containing protein [Polyangia bacterium]
MRLFVEGKDDLHSIINLLQRHGYDWNNSALAPFVHDSGGIEPLFEVLPSALKTYFRVGVVIDADLSPTNRWVRLEAILKASGIALPSSPSRQGLVIPVIGQARLERFGIWIMPNNEVAGALEDFLKGLVPEADTCWQHADTSTKQARVIGAPLKENDHAKGAIHTWLAWQDPPGQPFGTALNARILNHDSPEALGFVAWFKRLFGD